MSSSDTPRTDKEEFEAMGVGCEGDPTYSTFKAVEPDFARQLERELAAKDAELANMKRINQDNVNLMHKHANRADVLEKELIESRAQVARLRETLACAPDLKVIINRSSNQYSAAHDTVLLYHEWEAYKNKALASLPAQSEKDKNND